MYEAKVILDSVSPAGVRITTMQLRYWRGTHAEFMTHRVFSRNASSSRAIPVAKMLEQVRNNPAMPLHWGKNQPGMQAREELSGIALSDARLTWLAAAEDATKWAEEMVRLGVHKQVANRLLEPFQYISVIVTATEWDNFFALRDHPDAQPEIQHLARLMRQAMDASTPQKLDYGQWHLPYVSQEEQREIGTTNAIKCSVARCARVSYLTHDGQQPNVEKDIELHDKLVVSDPRHASPAEHQAQPLWDAFDMGADTSLFCRNFRGWRQYRALLEESPVAP